MKFIVTMKNPDVLYDSIYDAVLDEVNQIANLDEFEKQIEADQRVSIVRKQVSKWFRYGEYLSVEIDTDADTATVIRNI